MFQPTLYRCAIVLLAAHGLVAAADTGHAVPPQPQRIDMNASHWLADGNVTFSRGVMTVHGAGATLNDFVFSNGTIEYDINEDGDEQETSGIWFRRQDKDSADYFYLRPGPDCPGSVECIQYGPVVRGKVQWDVYPEYQASAPVHATGWNHVKLVISGKRMNVFLNGEAQPSLKVGSLEGEALSGGLQLRGNASYANLTITADAVEGLPPEPAADPTAADPRYLRSWRLSPVGSLARDQEALLANLPAAADDWQPIVAERKGYVNLSRHHGTAGGTPDLIWLKTTVHSGSDQLKHVALGYAREIWIFVNGKPVFADKNLYYPASGRKPPLGRMALDNGHFDLPLTSGDNEIIIAISNDLHSASHYGWGFEMRLDDMLDLSQPAPRRPM